MLLLPTSSWDIVAYHNTFVPFTTNLYINKVVSCQNFASLVFGHSDWIPKVIYSMSTPTHSFVTLACARVEAVLAYFGVVVVRQRGVTNELRNAVNLVLFLCWKCGRWWKMGSCCQKIRCCVRERDKWINKIFFLNSGFHAHAIPLIVILRLMT